MSFTSVLLRKRGFACHTLWKYSLNHLPYMAVDRFPVKHIPTEIWDLRQAHTENRTTSQVIEKSSGSVDNSSLFMSVWLHCFPPDCLYVSLYIQSQVQNTLNQFLLNSERLQTSQNKKRRGEQLTATLFKAPIERIWKDTHCMSQCPAVRALLVSNADVQMLYGGYIIHRALPLKHTSLKGGDGTRWLHNAW